jgi:hypothetical protein
VIDGSEWPQLDGRFRSVLGLYERWSTSHNLGDAGGEGAFRGRCASPRIVRLGTLEAEKEYIAAKLLERACEPRVREIEMAR